MCPFISFHDYSRARTQSSLAGIDTAYRTDLIPGQRCSSASALIAIGFLLQSKRTVKAGITGKYGTRYGE